MRIDSVQQIGGFPAVEIRRLMRQACIGQFTPHLAAIVLDCSESSALGTIKGLEKEGFVNRNGEYWELTVKGHALAMATAAKPLRKQTAQKLVDDLTERARRVNADDDRWAYRVRRVAVFGSFAAGVDRPNDVDVACSLVPRWTDPDKQQNHEQRRRNSRTSPFRNVADWAYWPRLEVLRYLKSRSRGLSIHLLDDWIECQTPYRIVFTDS